MRRGLDWGESQGLLFVRNDNDFSVAVAFDCDGFKFGII